MERGRFLHEEKIKDHTNLGVYGIFNTTKVEWKYYVISYKTNNSNNIFLTSEICGYSQEATFDGVRRNGKEFKTKEEGVTFIKEYKIKWETGSNNTTEEIRDRKLDDILDK